MKKQLILAILLLFVQNAFAQDVIFKLNGDEVPARVTEINLQSILYQHPDSVQGIIHKLAKADVFMVRFANGTKEVFEHNAPETTTIAKVSNSPEEMYQIGVNDAKILYKGKGAMWGSAACALVIPYGLAGSAAIAITKPKARNHPVSNLSYLSDPDYVKGYEKQAHRKKALKALAGVGITAATVTALVISLASVYSY